MGGCCALEVDISRQEYDNLVKMGLEKHITKNISKFISQNPQYKGKEEDLDEMYQGEYAVINQGGDGYCMLLDRKTRLCSVYENRPDTCIKFSNESEECNKIRRCID